MYLKGRPITMFMPKEQVDGYCLEAKGELPSNKLKLDWVYPLYGFYIKNYIYAESVEKRFAFMSTLM